MSRCLSARAIDHVLLERGEVTVTIDQCYQNKDAEFDGGRKEDCFSLAFIGKHKQLVLNSTNRRRLVNAYGPNVADWTGKEIVLHVEKVQAFGEMRNGIRIVIISVFKLKMNVL